MKIWELRAYLNSLPISMDDLEVFYNGGIDCIDGERNFLCVDFLEPCKYDDSEINGILLHNGYIDQEEEFKELALLN